MRRMLTGLALAGALALSSLPADAAPRYTLSLKSSKASVQLGNSYTLSGQLKPARAGVAVTRWLRQEGAWVADGSTRTNSTGRWTMRLSAPELGRRLTWQVRAKVAGKPVVSQVVSLDARAALPVINVNAVGPWQSILGADIASFQHGDSAVAIDFVKMYDAGVRFVYIKASDGRDGGHSRAANWYAADRVAAQAANLYTGFYHYAYLPDTSDQKLIVADARAQADKFSWRLAATGGLNSQDLNPALDLEESCVRATNGSCTARTTPALATLWALTWLERVELQTGRRPLLYSTPSWLEDWTTPSSTLRLYPLWIARYGLDQAAAIFPNPLVRLSGGCYLTAWTNNDCSSAWRLWQYTDKAPGTQYGVASTTIDLNVVADSKSLATLLAGSWVAGEADLAPANEATAMTADITGLKLAGGTVTATVKRPNGALVTAGSISVLVDGVALTGASIARSSSGSWTMQLPALPVGAQQLQFNYVDASGIHAATAISLPAPTV